MGEEYDFKIVKWERGRQKNWVELPRRDARYRGNRLEEYHREAAVSLPISTTLSGRGRGANRPFLYGVTNQVTKADLIEEFSRNMTRKDSEVIRGSHFRQHRLIAPHRIDLNPGRSLPHAPAAACWLARNPENRSRVTVCIPNASLISSE